MQQKFMHTSDQQLRTGFLPKRVAVPLFFIYFATTLYHTKNNQHFLKAVYQLEYACY
jgi:hypothetical protein